MEVASGDINFGIDLKADVVSPVRHPAWYPLLNQYLWPPQKQSMSEERSLNFIEEIIEADLKSGKHKKIVTRFPPEPNGYLHIGHATSICLNFGLSLKYGG